MYICVFVLCCVCDCLSACVCVVVVCFYALVLLNWFVVSRLMCMFAIGVVCYCCLLL